MVAVRNDENVSILTETVEKEVKVKLHFFLSTILDLFCGTGRFFSALIKIGRYFYTPHYVTPILAKKHQFKHNTYYFMKKM